MKTSFKSLFTLLAFLTLSLCSIVAPISAQQNWSNVHTLTAAMAAPPQLPRPAHIIIVIEENHGYDQIIGSNEAPYMNSLASQGASLTAIYALHHPSQPNYLELFSGSSQNVIDDSCLGTFSAPSLGGELIKKTFSFRGYAEGLPGNPLECKAGKYAQKHCPWIVFKDVNATFNLPFKRFPKNFNDLPTVAFVIPNLDNDMHDGSIRQADKWLKKRLDAYVQWAKTNNSLLILTWDEDSTSGCHKPCPTQPPQNRIPTILVGQMVKPNSTSAEQYTLHDLLRTVEDMYGLTLIGNSPNAKDITGIWK